MENPSRDKALEIWDIFCDVFEFPYWQKHNMPTGAFIDQVEDWFRKQDGDKPLHSQIGDI